MSTFNLNWTPTAEELNLAKQIIFEELFLDNKMRGIEVYTGVEFGQKFALTDGWGVIGKAFNGCKPKELASIGLTEKQALPMLMGARLKYCRANENQLFRLLNKSKKKFAQWFEANEASDEDFKALIGILMQSVSESLPTKLWFSDKAADTFANGGVFTNGTDLGLFNQIDGFWKQIQGESSIPRYTIAKNTGANYAAQAVTPAEAYEIVKNVYGLAPLSLIGDPYRRITLTRSVYRPLLVYMSENAKGCECRKELRDGKQVVYFIDTPVYPEDALDYGIQTYQNDGTKYNLPHRAIFTTPSNLVALTPATSKEGIAQFDKFYDKYEKANFVDVGWWLDAMLVNPKKIAVAY